MGVSSGFENNRFYEADRKSVTLSHSDFASEAGFENLEESEELVQYLLSKNYDQYFTVKRNNQVSIDTGIANTMFYTCCKDFHGKLDSVQIFHTVTDFFKVDSTYFFWKLVKRIRVLLIHDLKLRTDMRDERQVRCDKTHVQNGFNVKHHSINDIVDDADDTVTLSYASFTGTYKYCEDEASYFGCVNNISELVTFESSSVLEIEQAFQSAVRSHIHK